MLPKNEIFVDPKHDPGLVPQINQMMARGRAYKEECMRRGVRFLPRQVMRPEFAKLGLGDGTMLKPRSDEILVINLPT